MRLLLFFIITFLFSLQVKSQNFIWAKKLDGYSHVYGFASDAVGNLYARGDFGGTVDFNPGAGTNSLTSVASSDEYILKLDAAGNFLWVKQLSDVPGGGNIDVWGFAVDDAGNSYTVGHFNQTIDFDPGTAVYNMTSAGSYDVFVLKLDAQGNFVWAKQIGASGSDYGKSVVVDNNDNIYVLGSFVYSVDMDPGAGSHVLSSTGNFDVFAVKLDSAGNFIWAYSTGSTYEDRAHNLALDNANNLYISCDRHDIANIIKLDASGNEDWALQQPGVLYYTSRISVHNGDLFVTGNLPTSTTDMDPGTGVHDLSPLGPKDQFLLKLDLSGNFVWVKQFGGAGVIYSGEKAQVDAFGHIVLTDIFAGTIDFNPGPQQYNISSSGNYSDMFIVTLNSNGDFLSGHSYGNDQSCNVLPAVFDSQNNIYLAGHFSDTVDFDFSTAVYKMGSYNTSGYFLKLSPITGHTQELSKAAGIHVYPNPSTGRITISSTQIINNLQITDALGKLIYNATPNNNLHTTELNLAAGMYFVKITCGDEVRTEKLVISK